jgi:beta-fructofuranosidase
MAFARFRPTSHFIAPHSWMNDPCGAIYVPETQEYIVCYQWNPGTPNGGNSAWGMAKSRDLVTWEDCSPALRKEESYDHLGVFSGSIISRIVDGRRVLFLFYTSISALPLHVRPRTAVPTLLQSLCHPRIKLYQKSWNIPVLGDSLF